ncbi:AAA family ATPase [Caldithrix abyssi]
MITKIDVKNFKSFDHLNIELSNFNVVIGPNASGKSNFVQIFRFLKDIEQSGLENAVSLQGGVEYLRNMKFNNNQNFSLSIEADDIFGLVRPYRNKYFGIKITKTKYEFELTFFKRKKNFKISKDQLNLSCEFKILTKEKNQLKELENLGEGSIDLIRKNSQIKIRLNKPLAFPFSEEEIFPSFLWEKFNVINNLLIENPFFTFPAINEIFSDIHIYDFDPRLPKRATPISGKVELEENGSNMALILKNILSDQDKKRKLFNLMQEVLPYIHNLNVEKFADKSLLFKVQEEFIENQYIPALAISDGTINLTAIILALFFEKNKLIIIEEPERNIHPFLIGKLIGLMKDAARNKQIILTTHNAEFVKHTELENLFLCKRDSKGFSKIIKPADNKEIKSFLNNEIGVEDLFVQDLLDI